MITHLIFLVGSGISLSAFTDYAIVSPNASFATYDVSVGAVPDSGNLFMLAEVEKKYPGFGLFLALTGAKIRGADLVYVFLYF